GSVELTGEFSLISYSLIKRCNTFKVVAFFKHNRKAAGLNAVCGLPNENPSFTLGLESDLVVSAREFFKTALEGGLRSLGPSQSFRKAEDLASPVLIPRTKFFVADKLHAEGDLFGVLDFRNTAGIQFF